eukprot:2476435-Pleurochrysis_carterae.AAC.1
MRLVIGFSRRRTRRSLEHRARNETGMGASRSRATKVREGGFECSHRREVERRMGRRMELEGSVWQGREPEDVVDRLGRGRAERYLAVAGGHLLDHVGLAQLLSVQRVGVGDRHTAARLADELNVVALNVLDHQDLHLGQKVERELVHLRKDG